jgi:predicted PurR-regulated permease PerM
LQQPWDRIFSLGTRVFVWGLLAGVLYLLRPFFLLVFLTFVVAYILEHGVHGLKHRIPNRVARVVLVAVVFLGTLVTFGIALAPAFRDQAKKIGNEYQTYLAKIDAEIGAAREKYTWARNVFPEDARAIDIIEHLLHLTKEEPEVGPTPVETPAIVLLRDPDLIGPPAEYDPLTPRTPELRANASRKALASAMERLGNIASPILGIGSAFLLSLIFAFLIVLDLPHLTRAVRGLAHTKLGFIYDEVAENIRDFGVTLGKALEAQLIIAIANTVLTALGLWILGLTSNLVFLSTIVFFCSFIPVAGVFISSTPICLQALSEEGVPLMLAVVLMVLIVHMVEAYILNPKIYGHHLHMNAVLVLIVLTIAGKLIGMWGLILGLPVVNYFFSNAIRYDRKKQDHATAPPAPG